MIGVEIPGVPGVALKLWQKNLVLGHSTSLVEQAIIEGAPKYLDEIAVRIRDNLARKLQDTVNRGYFVPAA